MTYLIRSTFKFCFYMLTLIMMDGYDLITVIFYLANEEFLINENNIRWITKWERQFFESFKVLLF